MPRINMARMLTHRFAEHACCQYNRRPLSLQRMRKRPPFLDRGASRVRLPVLESRSERSQSNNMPSVKVKENEPFDVALRRFKRSCEKAGVLSEVRRREYYEKPTSVRKRKAAAAVKRHLKKLQRESRRFEKSY